MLKKILLLSGIALTLVLLWFAISNYRAAYPLAEENLHALALSLTEAIENIASQDPSLHSLDKFRPKDLAFLAIVDQNGIYRFHSNPDLINSSTNDNRYLEVMQRGEPMAGRVTLGTGESVYQFSTPLHLAARTLSLRLTLHTYRADAVIRKAELNITILISLLFAAWILSITIYRFAMREERHLLQMAQQENLARLGEMGATLAHEIRNPLSGIKGFAQLIEKKPTDERNITFAQRIIAETFRLETLVSDLLTYARSERITPAPVRLDEIVAHSVSLIRSEAEQQNIGIVWTSREGLGAYGDRNRLGQVLLNLLKNAIQAMPDGGALKIEAKAAGNHAIIEVSDSGQGISKEEMGRIFEPFYTTKAKGTGLGLALCKKIIDEHKGTIDVQSTVGKGTTFSIKLPAKLNSLHPETHG